MIRIKLFIEDFDFDSGPMTWEDFDRVFKGKPAPHDMHIYQNQRILGWKVIKEFKKGEIVTSFEVKT